MNLTALVTSVLCLLPATGLSTVPHAKEPNLPQVTLRQTVDLPKKLSNKNLIIPAQDISPSEKVTSSNEAKDDSPETEDTKSIPASTAVSSPDSSEEEAGSNTAPETTENFIYYISEIPLSESQQQGIYNICHEYGVKYTLVLGMLKAESNFLPTDVSHNQNGTVDRGIAQINSRYTDYYAKLSNIPVKSFDPFNIDHAVRAMCAQLSYLKNQFAARNYDYNTLMRYVLNAYNMGLSGFDHYVKSTGSTTRYYDQKILANAVYFQTLLS